MNTTFKDWVLVTGGSRGIGKSLVEHLCRSGHPVVFSYKSSAAAAKELEESLLAEGLACRAVRCDGSDPKHVESVLAEVQAQFGSPYGLINNAGITRDGLLTSSTAEEWDDVLDTNLGAAFTFIRLVASGMMERGEGVILQMTSVSGLRGIPGQTKYASSKAGMIGLTLASAVELARFNVRVNAIAPGFIETEILETIPSTQLRSLTKKIPLRRLGQTADVCNMVEFLLSSKASYITGQTFVIDGGLSISGV